MKLLVTGGDGFTGKHLIAQAVLNGYEIFSLKSNLLDEDHLQKEINDIKPDVVIHLAGISFVGHQNLTDFYQVNVVGTTNLLNVLVKCDLHLKAVLIASSANVYGNNENSPISELSQTKPINHYAASKLAMEHITSTYVNQLPVLIVRPFNYTGMGQNINFIIPKIAHHFTNQLPEIRLGNIEVEREYNDVRWVCSSYLKLINTFTNGEIYNICSGKTYNLRTIINLFESLTQFSPKIIIDSNFVRHNELLKLCGNPNKLLEATNAPSQYALQDTISWMLSE